MTTTLKVSIWTTYIKLTAKKHPRITKSLLGKTALVTGGNEGLGYEICLSLASRGCNVIIADKNDSSESRLKIIEETGNPNVSSYIVDLANLKSVRQFANEINGNVNSLNILVNNAGIAASKGELTIDGLNPVMQINFLSAFLLTHLLLDLLKKSSPSKILFTSSILSFHGNLKHLDLTKNQFESAWSCGGMAPSYPDSKLGCLMASDYFANILKGTGVTSIAYHPGAIRTRIMYQTDLKVHGIVAWLLTATGRLLCSVIGKLAWEVGEFVLYLMTSKEFMNVTGEFVLEDRIFRKPLQARDAELVQNVIDSTKRLLDIKMIDS